MRSDQCLNITYLNVLLVFYLRHWYLMHLKIDHRLLFPLVEIFVCKETGGRRTDKREREREREMREQRNVSERTSSSSLTDKLSKILFCKKKQIKRLTQLIVVWMD